MTDGHVKVYVADLPPKYNLDLIRRQGCQDAHLVEQLLANPLGELAGDSLDAVPFRRSPYYGLDVHLHMTVRALQRPSSSPPKPSPHRSPGPCQPADSLPRGLPRSCWARRCAYQLLRRPTSCLCRCTQRSWARAALHSLTPRELAAQRTGRRWSGSRSCTTSMQSTSSTCRCWALSHTGCRCACSTCCALLTHGCCNLCSLAGRAITCMLAAARQLAAGPKGLALFALAELHGPLRTGG